MSDLMTSTDLMCREEMADECLAIIRHARIVHRLAQEIEGMPADFIPRCAPLLARAHELLGGAIILLESKIEK